MVERVAMQPARDRLLSCEVLLSAIRNYNPRLWCRLHTLSDACYYAYGACWSNQASASLVMGKSWVPPPKAVNILCLKLQAATLAVKICEFLSGELKIISMSNYYWTESQTVLRNISRKNKINSRHSSSIECRRFETYQQQQWHHKASKEYPADIASRGANISTLPPCWLYGQEFLYNIS